MHRAATILSFLTAALTAAAVPVFGHPPSAAVPVTEMLRLPVDEAVPIALNCNIDLARARLDSRIDDARVAAAVGHDIADTRLWETLAQTAAAIKAAYWHLVDALARVEARLVQQVRSAWRAIEMDATRIETTRLVYNLALVDFEAIQQPPPATPSSRRS